MKSNVLAKIGLWVGTVLCFLSLLPAGFLIIINQIDKLAPKGDFLVLSVWAGACIFGPILSWIFFKRGYRLIPLLFLVGPLTYSFFRFFSDFI